MNIQEDEMLIKLYSIGFSPNKSKRIKCRDVAMVIADLRHKMKGEINGKRIKRILESTKPFV
jgi:hypothetical protein